MVIQFIAACLGTISFSVIFHVHKKYYPVCGAIGGIGWIVFLLSQNIFSVAESSFLATCIVAFASRTCAIYQRCPVTVFLIAGIFPLVPGAGIYWTAYEFVMNRITPLSSSGMTTIKTAFAIVLGIVFIFEIPQSFFHKMLRMGRK